jgi:hypothetical protein
VRVGCGSVAGEAYERAHTFCVLGRYVSVSLGGAAAWYRSGGGSRHCNRSNQGNVRCEVE